MAPRSAKRGGLSEDAPASVPTFTTTHAHAHRERLSGPALFSARAFPVAPGAVSRRCLDRIQKLLGHAGKKAAAHGATASKGAEAERAAISVPPRPRCSPPRPTGSEYSTRACMRRSRHAISADRCPLRARTSQSMPPRSPPRLPRSLTRPRPALRAPIAFLQSPRPASSLIDSYPCPRAWVPCRPGQVQQGKMVQSAQPHSQKGPNSTSRTVNLRSFPILLLLDSKYENEYYWFTCKQPCREIFNILLKCFF
jgi:hypothetical protein